MSQTIPTTTGTPATTAPVSPPAATVSATKEIAPKRRVIPDIIIESMEKGVIVRINKEGYGIEGFYRSGTIDIEIKSDGSLIAKSRRNRTDIIKTYDDLVLLNYAWWCQSREKEKDWSKPGKEWLEDFIRLDLVEREVVYKPKLVLTEK